MCTLLFNHFCMKIKTIEIRVISEAMSGAVGNVHLPGSQFVH